MSTLQTVIDRIDIGDLMVRYARAVDRCDAALFASVWAPDALVDYGDGDTAAMAWSDGLVGRLRGMDRTQHLISNSLVSLDGDSARAETMCTAYHRFTEAGVALRMLVGGRYLDRLVRTGDGWRIAHRRYVMDWNETEPSTMQTDGRFARFTTLGSRSPDDPSC
ncbi:nuclear transport factor 2 family protein [Polymorphobacter sp.]|uniref:nuclear transport factor 2 family protein n=1 Tax=Polymorphobacter sp. TaxID=1909290 RepID=UPI003F7127D0